MSDQPAGGTASIEENHLQTYMKLLKDCRDVAVRVFPRNRETFPEGLKSITRLIRPWQMDLFLRKFKQCEIS